MAGLVAKQGDPMKERQERDIQRAPRMCCGYPLPIVLDHVLDHSWFQATWRGLQRCIILGVWMGVGAVLVSLIYATYLPSWLESMGCRTIEDTALDSVLEQHGLSHHQG